VLYKKLIVAQSIYAFFGKKEKIWFYQDTCVMQLVDMTEGIGFTKLIIETGDFLRRF